MPAIPTTREAPSDRGLYAVSWTCKAGQQPRAVILAVASCTDSIDRYAEPYTKICQTGHFTVIGYDIRNNGKSLVNEADRGVTHFDDQLDDLHFMLNYVSHECPDVPLFISVHGFSAPFVAAYLCRRDVRHLSRLRGVVGYSIAFGFSKKYAPSSILLRLAAGFAAAVPRKLVDNRVDVEKELSRNRASNLAVHKDPFCKQAITYKYVLELLNNSQQLITAGYEDWPSSVSLAFFHGSADKLWDIKASRSFVEKLACDGKDATFVCYEDYYTDLWNEPGEDGVVAINAYRDWISSKLQEA